MGHHRLRAGLRGTPPLRRPYRRPRGRRHLRRRSDRLRAGLRARRSRPERGDDVRLPRPARCLGALLAPAALSLLAVMFTDAKERAKAFGIYGAVAGGGGAVGLILGGFLTEYLNWRWTFFVNIPFAIVAAAGAYFVIREPSGARNRAPLDIPGVVVLSTLAWSPWCTAWPAPVGRLVGRADRLDVRRRRRTAARLRRDRVAREVAAAAAARPHRAQPRWGLPLAGSRHHRDVRAVPLPDLLPPGREAAGRPASPSCR
ncbi:hypothetical protein SMICM17S_05370 [Streptomyces microflavus]